jgi:hypothetical protein
VDRLTAQLAQDRQQFLRRYGVGPFSGAWSLLQSYPTDLDPAGLRRDPASGLSHYKYEGEAWDIFARLTGRGADTAQEAAGIIREVLSEYAELFSGVGRSYEVGPPESYVGAAEELLSALAGGSLE